MTANWAIKSSGQFCLLSKTREKSQLTSHREAHCVSTYFHSDSFICFNSSMSGAGPSAGASGGSILWLWQAACDEKFSTGTNSGDEEESAVAGSRRKSRGRGGVEMRERQENKEVGELKVMNKGTMKEGLNPKLHTDRQTGSQASQGIKPRMVQGGQAEYQSCRLSLPGSSPWRWHTIWIIYERDFLLATHMLCPASFLHFALFYLLPG